MVIIPEGSIETRKFRELENKLSESESEVRLLHQRLKVANETVKQHSEVAEGVERQLKNILEENETFKKVAEAKFKVPNFDFLFEAVLIL